MTGPENLEHGELESGTDYGYDLAHDVPRSVRAPGHEPAAAGPSVGRPWSPPPDGDYGYDEAHGIS